jgi:hypothetical protein
VVAPPPAAAAGERRLLDLAAELGALAPDAGFPGTLEAALDRLRAAFGGSAPAAIDVFDNWLRTRGDKTRALALAWAREQVRLGLRELLDHEVRAGRARTDLSADTLAWLVLAGCEALAHEPPGADADRLRALLGFVRRAGIRR